jgi:hypothetical protein
MQHLSSAREPEDNLLIQEPKRMLRPSIKRKIVGIATGMIILAVITSVVPPSTQASQPYPVTDLR